jgi:hypothetical protein
VDRASGKGGVHVRDHTKKGLGTLVGNAGEYFVVAELLRRECVAALAPRNAPAFDILATRGGRTVRIRVKTRSAAKADKWQWNAKKDGTTFPELGEADDFTVLVTLPEDPRERPAYYIVPTASVDDRLRRRQAEFEKRGGSRENRHRCLVFRHDADPLKNDADWLAEYEGAWDRLWET